MAMVQTSELDMADSVAPNVGAFMADLAGRRSVLFPKTQREAGEKEIFGTEIFE